MQASVEPKLERSVGSDFGLVLDKIGKEELYISTIYSGRMIKHRLIQIGRPLYHLHHMIYPSVRGRIATCLAGGSRKMFLQRRRKRRVSLRSRTDLER